MATRHLLRRCILSARFRARARCAGRTAPAARQEGSLVIIRALISVFSAVLRSAASTFLLIASMMVTAIVVLALLGVFGVGLTGVLGRVLSRRRSNSSD